jgi:hypothetical protein
VAAADALLLSVDFESADFDSVDFDSDAFDSEPVLLLVFSASIAFLRDSDG